MTHTWREAVSAFWHPSVITMLFLGFGAGIPILLIFGSLSVWLREADVARSTVTFFSWAALGYSFKYLWAPLIDKLPVPGLTSRLGRRRAWLLVSQLGVICAILLMAITNPQTSLIWTAIGAVTLGFASATQDIVIDAYRIEAADKDLQAMMSSSYIAGYRIGMLLAGAGTLKLAAWWGSGEHYHYAAWGLAYAVMAGAMLVGVFTTLVIAEPAPRTTPQATVFRATGDYVRFLILVALAVLTFICGFVLLAPWAASSKSDLISAQGLAEPLAGFVVELLRFSFCVVLAIFSGGLLVNRRIVPSAMIRETYIAPFADFLARYGKAGLLLLLLIGTYRISDIVLGAVANVFYIDLGFSKDQIADIAKTFGLLMTIAGGFLGGVLAVRYGLLKTLLLGAILVIATNLLFALLAISGQSLALLIVVIAADNLAGGLASAAFIAYLSSVTNVSFTATQYALFSSIMTLFPKILAGYSGSVVDSIGYAWFFVGASALGVPVLFLVIFAARLEKRLTDNSA